MSLSNDNSHLLLPAENIGPPSRAAPTWPVGNSSGRGQMETTVTDTRVTVSS